MTGIDFNGCFTPGASLTFSASTLPPTLLKSHSVLQPSFTNVVHVCHASGRNRSESFFQILGDGRPGLQNRPARESVAYSRVFVAGFPRKIRLEMCFALRSIQFRPQSSTDLDPQQNSSGCSNVIMVVACPSRHTPRHFSFASSRNWRYLFLTYRRIRADIKRFQEQRLHALSVSCNRCVCGPAANNADNNRPF